MAEGEEPSVWNRNPVGFAIGEDQDDPATAKASAALEKILLERFFSNIRRFDLERSRYAQDVQDVTGTVQSIAFATPEERARSDSDRPRSARSPFRLVPTTLTISFGIANMGC